MIDVAIFVTQELDNGHISKLLRDLRNVDLHGLVVNAAGSDRAGEIQQLSLAEFFSLAAPRVVILPAQKACLESLLIDPRIHRLLHEVVKHGVIRPIVATPQSAHMFVRLGLGSLLDRMQLVESIDQLVVQRLKRELHHRRQSADFTDCIVNNLFVAPATKLGAAQLSY